MKFQVSEDSNNDKHTSKYSENDSNVERREQGAKAQDVSNEIK